MVIRGLSGLTLVLMFACGAIVTSERSGAAQQAAHERIVGVPCEGCESVFVGMPASINSPSRIAPVTERGEPMKLPQHIHLHVIEPGRCTYYIDDVQFTDDPRLTAERRASEKSRGGPGITTPGRDDRGVWQVTRDIHLGQNIPGYASCDAQGGQKP